MNFDRVENLFKSIAIFLGTLVIRLNWNQDHLIIAQLISKLLILMLLNDFLNHIHA